MGAASGECAAKLALGEIHPGIVIVLRAFRLNLSAPL
jgi:hypothetical protein